MSDRPPLNVRAMTAAQIIRRLSELEREHAGGAGLDVDDQARRLRERLDALALAMPPGSISIH